MAKRWFFLGISNSLFALTTLNVSMSSDNDPGGFGEMGDLRYCLNTMNQDLNMAPDDYAIGFDFPMTIQLNGILPILNNSLNPVNLTIGNPGSIPTVTIDGNGGSYSGFFIPTGVVTVQNMIFQNLSAKGGTGGDGISGGGGGMGAGGAIYVPQTFLLGSNPSVTLMNVRINSCSAIGGNGGSCNPFLTGNEGGGGGGGYGGNGGSITTIGITGGAGGGGFGGNGGDVTLSTSDPSGGGGGGGGGLGSRATMGMLTNLGTGGFDNGVGQDGNGYGLSLSAGSGGGGLVGGNNAGGGGGGADIALTGGGGGGSSGGFNGSQPQGSIPPGGSAIASGGAGADGGGGGGGGVVTTNTTNNVDGQAGNGGYCGGGGGGAGSGADDPSYTVEGGNGGVCGGGGGGGVNLSGTTLSNGGNSLGGGGGGGGGPSSGLNSNGGSDIGQLGGGSGGNGGDSNLGEGGAGGGGGSGLGGAIFVDSGLNFTLQALSGIPTIFDTLNNTTQAGTGGSGSSGAMDGFNGSSLGNSIFLRTNSSLTLLAQDPDDLLTLGEGVDFTDDTSFGAGSTRVLVTGNGTVIYNGTTDYQGTLQINNATFQVNGQINQASILVCRNIGLSSQRGTLSGSGMLAGDVFVNSGTISPDTGKTLTLGSLILSPADPMNGTLGSLVRIGIDASGSSLVSINGAASLAGILEINLDPAVTAGNNTLLTSSGITGTFDSIVFSGVAPSEYVVSYLPTNSPTFVQFEWQAAPPIPPPAPPPAPPSLSTQGLRGNNLKVANYLNLLAPNAAALGLVDQFELLNNLSSSQYEEALESIDPVRNTMSTFSAQNVMFMFSESLYSHFTNNRLAHKQNQKKHLQETAFLADNAVNPSPRQTMYAPAQNTHSQVWAMSFGQFSHQNSQAETAAFSFDSGGFCVGYDYGNMDLGCIGAAAGYAFSSIEAEKSMGKSHLNGGYLSIYGMRFLSDFFVETAISGEYQSVDQQRKISFTGFSSETAKSSYHAKQLDLHLGTGYDFNIHTGTIEPFALLDWVQEWDPSYTEKGAAPYNMKISSRTSWMLRFETGLNGYQTTTFSWGILIAQAKLSYVYKKPHHVGQLNALIVGAPTSFIIESFVAEQNLVSPAVELFWQTNWNGYGSISYDAEFGSGYSSNQFYGKIGYSF